MSGGTRTKCGAFVGTGADLEIHTVGFRPRSVICRNVTGLVTAEWQETMADDSMLKRVTAGDMTNPTTNGITPTADGFNVGADADLNASGEIVHWEARE
jgi:hypothetical protein